MSQPVPQVTDLDVDRIVRREFAHDDVAAVLGMLAEYGRRAWHREAPRVRLAVLKLAGGNVQRLKENLAMADQDYRDVLCAAEYPSYFAEISPAENDQAKRRRVEAADWAQYREWFERGGPNRSRGDE